MKLALISANFLRRIKIILQVCVMRRESICKRGAARAKTATSQGAAAAAPTQLSHRREYERQIHHRGECTRTRKKLAGAKSKWRRLERSYSSFGR